MQPKYRTLKVGVTRTLSRTLTLTLTLTLALTLTLTKVDNPAIKEKVLGCPGAR